jgi:hypothetical protein
MGILQSMQNNQLDGRASFYYPNRYQIDTLQNPHQSLPLCPAMLSTSARHPTSWPDNWYDKTNLHADNRTTQPSTIPPSSTVPLPLQPWLVV